MLRKMLVGLLIIAATGSVAWSGIPMTINFQGKFSPNNLPGAEETITFDLGRGQMFSPLSGNAYVSFVGNPVWSESFKAKDLGINSEGLFDAVLGAKTPKITVDHIVQCEAVDSQFPQMYFPAMRISVGGQVIGTQRLTTVPYAVRAQSAETIGGKTLYQITSEVITQAATGGEWIKSGDFVYRMGNVAIGKSTAGYPLDVRTQAPNATAVQAEGTKVGVLATATAANGWGVFGGSQRVGVYGLSVNPNAPSIGVVGANPGTRPLDMGVYGGSPNIGVVGGGAPVLDGSTITFATANTGVWGAGSQVGVLGTSATGQGVKGIALNDQEHYGILGAADPEPKVQGQLQIIGQTTRKAGVYGQVGARRGYLGLDSTLIKASVYGTFGDYHSGGINVEKDGISSVVYGETTANQVHGGYFQASSNSAVKAKKTGPTGTHDYAAVDAENTEANTTAKLATTNYGVYGKTSAANKRAGHFENTATAGSRVGLYASSAKIGDDVSSTPTFKIYKKHGDFNSEGKRSFTETKLIGKVILSISILVKQKSSDLWETGEYLSAMDRSGPFSRVPVVTFNPDTGEFIIDATKNEFGLGKYRLLVLYEP